MQCSLVSAASAQRFLGVFSFQLMAVLAGVMAGLLTMSCTCLVKGWSRVFGALVKGRFIHFFTLSTSVRQV